MEKVAGHTATPWEYSGGGIWGKSPLNARVRLADMVFHNSINRISSEANAAFIVQAVNSHDELVAALKAIINSDMAMREEDEGNRSAVLDAARAALSRATNEKG